MPRCMSSFPPSIQFRLRTESIPIIHTTIDPSSSHHVHDQGIEGTETSIREDSCLHFSRQACQLTLPPLRRRLAARALMQLARDKRDLLIFAPCRNCSPRLFVAEARSDLKETDTVRIQFSRDCRSLIVVGDEHPGKPSLRYLIRSRSGSVQISTVAPKR